MNKTELDQGTLYSALKEACRSIQVERGEKEVQAVGEFSCASTYPGFAGHFPQLPILPAICQLMAVRLVAEKSLGLTLVPENMKRVKLKKKVGPEEIFVVQVGLVAADNRWQADFTIKVDGKTAASGSLQLVAQGQGEEG